MALTKIVKKRESEGITITIGTSTPDVDTASIENYTVGNGDEHTDTTYGTKYVYQSGWKTVTTS